MLVLVVSARLSVNAVTVTEVALAAALAPTVTTIALLDAVKAAALRNAPPGRVL
jgi:hypothetical protein